MLATNLLGRRNIMFVGRKNELEVLNKKINSKDFELGVIYGQRRIGKTSTVLKALKGTKYIYFLARDTTSQDNLIELSKAINEYFKLPHFYQFNSIDDALDELFFKTSGRIIVFIDELPFIAKAYPGIISYLQKMVDDLKRINRQVKIILSGSDISFMVDLLTNKAKPLYQRATFKMHIEPLRFSDAIKMLYDFDSVDKAKYLAIFGNRPYYLEKLNKEKDFDTNIKDLCFDSTSILIDAPNMTLPIGYTTNSSYISILIAIANRKHKIKEIANQLNIDDKTISTYLGRMLEGESVEKRNIFNGNKKSVFYEISDPFIRMYYSVIYKNLPNIELGYKEEIFRTSKDMINRIIEHGFEDVSNSYINELSLSGKLPHTYHPLKKYNADNSILNRSIQIDGISDSFDEKHLLVMEAKFRDKDVSLEILNHLKENASIFKGYETVDYYLVSKKSFADNIKNTKDPHVHLITLDEMMGNTND